MDEKTKEFVEKAKEVHSDYNYDYSQAIYVNKRTKVKIYCPKHDNWFTPLPGVHINQKTRCRMCGKESGDSKQTITKEEFIDRAKELHGDKYDYNKVIYKNSYTKVNIICEDHGQFSVRPKDHLKSGVYTNGNLLCSGCPKCGDIRAAVNRTKSTGDFIEKAVEAHGDEKFDYSKVDYKHTNTNIIVICKKHNLEFKVTPSNFTSNIHNCPECYKEVNSELGFTTEEFIENCKKIHGELYDYSEVNYTGIFDKIIISCKKHGKFTQEANAHKRGQGCPHCSTSKGELAVKSYLEQNNIKFEQQKTFIGCVHKNLLKFDFYLPDHNVVIEFQGRQHFEEVSYFGGEDSFKEIVLKDQIKADYCKSSFIELITIDDSSEIKNKLSRFIEFIVEGVLL